MIAQLAQALVVVIQIKKHLKSFIKKERNLICGLATHDILFKQRRASKIFYNVIENTFR